MLIDYRSQNDKKNDESTKKVYSLYVYIQFCCITASVTSHCKQCSMILNLAQVILMLIFIYTNVNEACHYE